jgi:hypothetical protein
VWIPLGPARTIIGAVTIEKSNNVRIRDAVVKEPILFDEDGASPADEANVGNDVMVEVDIARDSWEDIATLIPTLYSVGTAPNELIERRTNVGELDSQILQVLKIQLYSGGAPDATGYRTFTFPSVAVTQVWDLVFAARGQRFARIQCRAYKDVNNRYWYKGTPV